jgi:hypothetical protein
MTQKKPDPREIQALRRSATQIASRIQRCIGRCRRVRNSLSDMRQRAQDPSYSAPIRAAFARNADEAEADMRIKEAELNGLFGRLERTLDELRELGVEPPGALLTLLAERRKAPPVNEEE